MSFKNIQVNKCSSKYLSPPKLWVRTPFMAMCLSVCHWLATGRWFSPNTLRFPPTTNCPPRYNWHIVQSGVKHHKPKPNQNTLHIKIALISIVKMKPDQRRSNILTSSNLEPLITRPLFASASEYMNMRIILKATLFFRISLIVPMINQYGLFLVELWLMDWNIKI